MILLILIPILLTAAAVFLSGKLLSEDIAREKKWAEYEHRAGPSGKR